MSYRTIKPNDPANFTPELGDYKTLQPFRYWCQKVLPLIYDDSLSYYELLCKVVDYLNKTMEDVETLNTDVNALHTAYENLQNYVNSYFDTLDVQEEINNKLDDLVRDGTLTKLISTYIDPLINEQNGKITVLEERMNTFASLPEGSTSGNAELADIRVPALGFNNNKPYPTAGEAVRGQVGILSNALFSSNIIKNLLTSVTWIDGSFISDGGWPVDLAGYSRTEPIKINGGTILKFKAQGYETKVAMIAQFKNERYTPILLSKSSNVEEYEYTVTETGYYVFSALKAKIDYLNAITIIDVMPITVAKEVVKENNIAHGIETNIAIKANEGKYVAYNGVVIDLAGYYISDIITLPPKAKISFYGAGYEKNVSMISEYKSGRYKPLVVSRSSNFEVYEYTCETKIDIVLSGTGLKNSSASVSINVLDSVAEISSKLEEIGSTSNSLDDVSLSLFTKFGVVGDSYASGEIYDKDNHPYDKYNISWGQIMARNLGTQCINYSEGGLTTGTWLNASRGLALLNSSEAQDIYYLCLGINDIYFGADAYLGTIADIETKANSFYGNYGKIINAIKTKAPNAKMIIFTVALTGATADKYNNAILEIADYFKIPYAKQLDDAFFSSDFYLRNQVAGHPIAICYSGMANGFERLIKKCVINNVPYFRYMYAHN